MSNAIHRKRGDQLTQNHLQEREPQSNSEVNHNSTAFLGFGNSDCPDTSDVVKAAIDAERSSRNRNSRADLEAGS